MGQWPSLRTAGCSAETHCARPASPVSHTRCSCGQHPSVLAPGADARGQRTGASAWRDDEQSKYDSLAVDRFYTCTTHFFSLFLSVFHLLLPLSVLIDEAERGNGSPLSLDPVTGWKCDGEIAVMDSSSGIDSKPVFVFVAIIVRTVQDEPLTVFNTYVGVL